MRVRAGEARKKKREKREQKVRNVVVTSHVSLLSYNIPSISASSSLFFFPVILVIFDSVAIKFVNLLLFSSPRESCALAWRERESE
jgi:hypothetical protein